MPGRNLNQYGSINIEDFINHYFIIPNYQRDYAWEKDQMEDFLMDLDNVCGGAGNDHFFGQIVLTTLCPENAQDLTQLPDVYKDYLNNLGIDKFHTETNYNELYQVIDGQQRLTTIIIFIKVLYNKLSEILPKAMVNGDQDLTKEIIIVQNDIEQKVIGDAKNPANVQHLCVRKKDEAWFNDNIIKGMPPAYSSHGPLPHSRKQYCLANQMFTEYFDKKLAALNDINEIFAKLKEIKECLFRNFYILYLTTRDHTAAFIIFETLNARGRDLAAADLLKNHILSCLPEGDADRASNDWDNMLEILGKAEPTKYIRSYWNSQKSLVREKLLYRVICREANTEDRCQKLLTDLKKYASLYHDLAVTDENPLYFASADDKPTDKAITKTLKYLALLKASTYYPIVIAMAVGGFQKANIKDVLSAIEIYIFRNICVCGGNPNDTETFFAEIARDITSRECGNTDDEIKNNVIKRIKEKTVKDDLFKTNIREGFDQSKNQIRYFFAKIHEYHFATSVVDQNWNQTHIEHIMPQDKKEWPQITDDIHKLYLWNIGNLTLLNVKPNVENSNHPYKTKHPQLSKDIFYPTKQLLTDKYDENTDWNVKTIEERRDLLVDEALEIWKV